MTLPPLFATIRYRGRSHRMRGLTREDLLYQRWRKTARFYELPLLEAIRDAGRQGVYVDAGANLGNHSVFFACHCPATRVIAIEARAEAAAVLQDNLKRNASCPHDVHAVAVADQPGQAQLSPLDRGNVGSTSADCGPLAPGRAYDALVWPLDYLVQSKTSVAVLKLDIEGGELAALQGAESILRRDAPLVAVEAATPEKQAEVFRFLADLGYHQQQQFLKGTPTFLWSADGA